MMTERSEKKTQSSLLLGIDGGGSNTVAWLAESQASGSPTILGRGKSGPSNCRSVGFDTAMDHIAQSIDQAFDDASTTKRTVDAICLALAGADRPSEQEHFREWARRHHPADTIVVSNDVIPIIYAAFESGTGVALIAGTGSIAMGRSQHGKVERCGGWGGLFGDEGSGFAMGIAALRAASRDEDGRGPKTELRAHLVESWGVRSLYDAIPELYAASTDRAKIAEIAPIVFQAAANGDAVATQIVRTAADALTELASTVNDKMGMDGDPVRLALGGGLLLRQPDFATEIVNRMEHRCNRAVESVVVESPVVGAVNMAFQAIHS